MPDQQPWRVRQSLPADVLPVMALDASLSETPWSQQALEPYFGDADRHSHSALVLEIADAVAGFLVYTRLLDEASLDQLAVAGEHQRAGCGQALLTAGLGEMAAAGLVRCLLEVRESNVAARRLYENNGFLIDGVRPRYYPTAQGREDALLMSRRI